MNDTNKLITPDTIRINVREHYGGIAEKQAACGCSSSKAVSSNCCGGEADTNDLAQIERLYEAEDVTELPEEITGLSLGCGDPVTLASLQPGQTVLDLGSGGGIDCFLAARRVGPTGKVIGVDMTPQMIDRARANKEKLMAGNVEFRLGEIEHLPVADNSVDVIISNCVINLSPDKPQVFRDAFRALRPGGRLAVSDIVTDGPLPEMIRKSLNSWAGCVAGALDQKEYISAIQAAGFVDVSITPVYFDQDEIAAVVDQLEWSGQGTDGHAKIVIREGDDLQVVELLDDNGNPVEVNPHSIFSAKVTAVKPT